MKNMQGQFTLVKIDEKNVCFGEKDIPIWWSFIFTEGPFFLAKSDLASTISSNTMPSYIAFSEQYFQTSVLAQIPLKPSKKEKANGFQSD